MTATLTTPAGSSFSDNNTPTGAGHLHAGAAPINLDQRLATIEALLTQIAANQVSGDQEAMIRDVSMSFGSMVTFMVKWAFAAVPAGIIISTFFGLFLLLFWSVLVELLRVLVR